MRSLKPMAAKVQRAPGRLEATSVATTMTRGGAIGAIIATAGRTCVGSQRCERQLVLHNAARTPAAGWSRSRSRLQLKCAVSLSDRAAKRHRRDAGYPRRLPPTEPCQLSCLFASLMVMRCNDWIPSRAPRLVPQVCFRVEAPAHRCECCGGTQLLRLARGECAATKHMAFTARAGSSCLYALVLACIIANVQRGASVEASACTKSATYHNSTNAMYMLRATCSSN